MEKNRERYNLLTFYKFVDIDNPEQITDEHRLFLQDIGVKGRVYISSEGISSTVTANQGQTLAYKLYLENIPYFRDIPDIDDKATVVEEHKFSKLIVRHRKEIIALGEPYKASDIENSKRTLSPEKFKEMMEQKPDDFVIVDMRNNYEYELGHFKGAIPAGTESFRELPSLIDKYKEEFSNKNVLMYCTGGIRCEKAAVFLDRHGLNNFYQLDGGIVKYLNTFNDGNWLGNLYTFDNRVSTDVGDQITHSTISLCKFSGKPTTNMYNCRYGPCNRQYMATAEEYARHFGFCSQDCTDKAKHDFYIRPDKLIDSMNYKELRGKIKADPNLKESITAQMLAHVQKHLDGVQF